MIPTSDMASMANNLPRKIASIGTAAARISITLFDFSSISCDSSMPASRRVRTNRIVCPPRATSWRAKARLPDELSASVTASAGAAGGDGAGLDAPRFVDEQADLAHGAAVGRDRAGEVRRGQPAVEHADALDCPCR